MDSRDKINTIEELYYAIQLTGLKSCFDGLIAYKGEVGFTFNLRECIKEDKYVGLPDFDSGFTLSDDEKKKLDMLTARFVNDQIRKKRMTLMAIRKDKEKKQNAKNKKKKDNPKTEVEDESPIVVVENVETNVDGGIYYSYPFDLHADVNRFHETGKLEWQPVDKLSSYCCKCLGKLKEPVLIGEFELNKSRPDQHDFDINDSVKGGYTTFYASNDRVTHLVHWANNHGMNQDLPFIDFPNYFPGFRHLYQQYNHVHNHYIQDYEFEDKNFLCKGWTNSIGSYVTSCFIENFTKLHKQSHTIYIRGLTGCFPFSNVYNSFINDQDRLIYECLCIQVIFGLYGPYTRDRKGFLQFFETLSSVVQLVDTKLMSAIIYGPLIIPSNALKWYKDHYSEYLSKFKYQVIDFGVDQQALIEEAQALLDQLNQ